VSAQVPINAIEVEHLRKVFGEVVAVDDLTFTVPQGEVVGLLGGNGAGKTTTLSMLLSLLLPTSGRITVLGEDIARHRYRVLGRMNFSSPYVDLPHRLTVRQNLEVYARLYGVRDVKGRVQELARRLEFEELMKRPLGQLSAGQKTRVALAKALVNHPDMLLLDEPTASLDPDSADWMRGLLRDYQKETGASILLASHNMVEVERLCSHVLLMRTGRIVERGSPQELIGKYGRDTMEEVFLDIARGRGQFAGAVKGEAAQ
jgi:ABC-2 type transport system ATP-binding protein